MMSRMSLRRTAPAALVAGVLGLTAAVVGGGLRLHRPTSGKAGPTLDQVRVALQETPLHFEPAAGKDQYVVRGPGYGLKIAANKNRLVLAPSSKETVRRKPAQVQVTLVGANSQARSKAEKPQTSRSNYFIGKDPKKWRTAVAHFGQVRYEQVYRGIDVVYYGKQGQLEYDFVVHPGASPDTVRMRYDGVSKVRIADNRLTLSTPLGEIQQDPPIVYQESGSGKRTPVPAHYVKLAANEIGFQVADYDRSRTLVIDPVLRYSTYIGGALADEVTDLVVDADGNAYVTGFTASTDFPLLGNFQGDAGTTDAFVSKLNPQGTGLVFSTYLGGGDDENAVDPQTRVGSIALDGNRNVYVAGLTRSVDFPVVLPVQVTNGGNGDGFVTKLNAAGSGILYSTYHGGRNVDVITDISVDASANAYVIGSTNSDDLNIANAFQPNFGGGTSDAFVARYNVDGTGLVYSTYLGGSDFDRGIGLAVDGTGNLYTTGQTNSTDFPIANAFQPQNEGVTDAFITKFDPVASQVQYSSYLGGSGENAGTSVAVDESGSAYVTGFTTSTDFPVTAGAFDESWNGGESDGFLTKIAADGSSQVYSTYLGGNGEDVALSVGVSVPGNDFVLAYVTGFTESTNFPVKAALRTSLVGVSDAFVTKFNADAGDIEYSTYLGGSAEDRGRAIAADVLGNAYVAGVTESTNFPALPTGSVFDSSFNGVIDGFISHMSSPPAAPINLVGTPLSSTTIRLTWDDTSDNETAFEIERRLPPGGFVSAGATGPNISTFDAGGLQADTEYVFRVRARNGTGASPFSNAVTVKTFPAPPTAPNNLVVTTPAPPGGRTSLTLTFLDTSNAETGFRIERVTGADFATGTNFTTINIGARTGTGNVTHTDASLSPNTQYAYRVVAFNLGGDSAASNEASGTTLPNPPPAPTGLTAVATSSVTVDLAWTENGTDETGFRVFRSTDNVTFSQIAVINQPDTGVFTDPAAPQDTKLWYRVTTMNSGGDSAASNTVTVTTVRAPTNLNVTAQPGQKAKLEWVDNSTKETGFRIERSTDGISYTQIAQVNTQNLQTFTDQGLVADTNYFYRVRAFNATGNSSYSNVDSTGSQPANPSDLTAIATSSSTVDLNWTDNATTETGFRIFRSEDGVTFTQVGAINTPDATSFTDTSAVGDKTYRYVVRANNDSGLSGASNQAIAETVLAPTALNAAPLSTTDILLTWNDNSTRENGYAIERSIDGAGFIEIKRTGENIKNFKDTGLTPETKYEYRVRGFRGTSNSSYSNTDDARTAPAAPTDLTLAVVGPNQINLFWTKNSANEDGFRVQRVTGTDFNSGTNLQEFVLPNGATTFEATGLTPNTNYAFRVQAFNESGGSAFSNVATAKTLPLPPAAPTNLAAQVLSQSEIKLTWKDNSTTETNFEIERSSDGGLTFNVIAAPAANATTFTDSGLPSDSEFIYRVRAVNGGGNSDFSNEVTARTLPDAPLGPSDLEAEATSESTVELTWTDNSNNETSYIVERKIGNGAFQQIKVLGADADSYSDSGLSPNTQVTYRVKAKNAGGNSADSNEVSLLMPPARPTNVRAKGISSTEIRVDWNSNGGADSFRIEFKPEGATQFQLAGNAEGTARSFVIGGLLPSTRVTVRVRASNEGGLSGFSNEATDSTLVGLASVTVDPEKVKGGKKAKGTIRLTGPAPKGGTAVRLSSDSKVAQVPTQIVVPQGASSATFTVTTKRTNRKKTAVITATLGKTAAQAILTVKK